MKQEQALHLEQRPFAQAIVIGSNSNTINWDLVIRMVNHAREFGAAQVVLQEIGTNEIHKAIKLIDAFVKKISFGTRINVQKHDTVVRTDREYVEAQCILIIDLIRVDEDK